MSKHRKISAFAIASLLSASLFTMLGRNSIRTDVMLDSIGLSKMTSVKYYDGLGRLEQTVAVEASPSGADLIQHNSRDRAGNPVKYVNPSGCDGVVCINGSNVLINSNIFLYGQGATLSVVKQMQQDINTIWGGKYSVKYKNNTYDVSIVATVSLYGNKEQNIPFVILDKFNPFSRNNYIEVSNRVKRSFVKRGDEGKWRSEGRHGISLSEDDSAPHEFGHLLGLDDHYSDVNGKSIPEEGWESNIMGNSVSGKVDERIIFDILKEVLIKYDEWRNNGNYGEFRYEINP